ncbi:hypothetical protein GOA86_07240 [Sinorhizobium meliloti]|nr:hypothetical protein [Sinorhizobium meliloti]
MADKEKMKQLIWDCQKDIAEYLPPESGISEHDCFRASSPASMAARLRKRWATIGRDGGRMMMMAVETTVPFPSHYRSRPESGQPRKWDCSGTFPPNARFEKRSYISGCSPLKCWLSGQSHKSTNCGAPFRLGGSAAFLGAS